VIFDISIEERAVPQ